MGGGDEMAGVELHKKAPDFEMEDYTGKKVKLSDFEGRRNVIIVLNRGFV